MTTRIIGTGSCLPKKVLTNTEMETIVETSDEWIKSRTGIEQRHMAIEETTTSLAVEAARRALEDAKTQAEEITETTETMEEVEEAAIAKVVIVKVLMVVEE